MVDAHLLEVRPGAGELRYGFHDLVRAYARERAVSLGEAERGSALARAFDLWAEVTARADAMLPSPGLDPLRNEPHSWASGVALEGIAVLEGRSSPLDWFDRERWAVLGCIEQASDAGFVESAWRLAHASISFWATHRHIALWRRACQAALTAAQAHESVAGQALMARGLAQSYVESDDLEAAEAEFRLSLELAEGLDEPASRAFTQTLLASVRRLRGDPAEAQVLLGKAIATLEGSGRPRLLGYALSNLGIVHREQGRLAQAHRCAVRALALYEADGDTRFRAYLTRSIGLIEKDSGRTDLARPYFVRALPLMQQLGDEFGEALVLSDLASVEADVDTAHALLARAISMSRQAGDAFALARSLFLLGGRLAEGPAEAAEAVAAFEEALTLWRSIDTPLWEGRTLLQLSRLKASVLDDEGARRDLDRALELLDAVGAPEADEARVLRVGRTVAQ